MESSPLLRAYITKSGAGLRPDLAAVYASLDHLSQVQPVVAAAIIDELRDQRNNLKLIASENYSSLSVQLAQGNWFTDKYAEGYPGHRFYAGCDNVDAIESEAARLACQLFGAEHAYVQPHSGADANLVAFLALLSAQAEAPLLEKAGASDPSKLSREQWNEIRASLRNRRLLALDYYSGGHLTHGYRHNISAQLFDAYSYSVDPETKELDMDALNAQIKEVKPFILLAGYSAYPRKINFAALRQMAEENGSLFMVDMAHFAGLVAGKVFSGDFDPVAHAHLVTSTTHKTLRGPRGGLILCKKEFSEWVDKGCPSVLGGPLPHVMAAKAVAFSEASQPEFAGYARQIVKNAQTLASACLEEGLEVLTGGTDNHLLLIDVAATYGLTGRQAEAALRECGLTLNRNALPYDVNGPWYTSGLRIGTPAVTTLGMKEKEMREVARLIKAVLSRVKIATIEKGEQKGQSSKAKYHLDESVRSEVSGRVQALLKHFPVYPEIDLELLLSKRPAA